MELDIILVNSLVIWLLIFMRLGATLMLIPVFGATNAPMRVKTIFVAVLALIFTMAGNYQVGIDITKFNAFALGVIFEIINGIILGFVVVSIMNAIYLAGLIIDMNMGFAMANVISPTDEAQVPITANFYYLLVMILFIITNAHHYIIIGFTKTLKNVPLGQLAFSPLHVEGYFELIKETFVIGFQLAMPIITVILVANIILGLLSKAMPGMNVFMIGMPFKILVGIATLFIVLPTSVKLIMALIQRTMDYINRFIALMF